MSHEDEKNKIHESLRTMSTMESFMDTIKDIAKVNPEKSSTVWPDFDEYFLTKVYPCLMHGLEDLALEVEGWNEGDIDVTAKKRFNPCFYLAQFLMRNNPLYLNNDEKYRDNHILRREQKRRVIQELKTKIVAKIEGHLKGSVYPIEDITNVFIEIDELLNAQGHLKKSYVSFS